MVMVSKLSNFPDELSAIDELKEFELSGSDCNCINLLSANAKVAIQAFYHRCNPLHPIYTIFNKMSISLIVQNIVTFCGNLLN